MNKNISKYLFLCLTVLMVGLTSCVDEEGFNNEIYFDLERGGFVRFEEAFDPLIGTTDPTSFEYNPMMEDPNGNLSEYRLYNIDGADTFLVETYTDIAGPFALNLTAAKVAAATGRDVSSFEFGETLEFVGEAVRNDGVVFTADPLEADFETGIVTGSTQQNLYANGYKNALVFDLIIACPTPPDAANYVGSFTVVSGGWFETGAVVQVVEGAGENEIIIQDLPGAGSVSGVADFPVTLNEDQTVSFSGPTGWSHSTYGPMTMNQSSAGNFTFECANNRIILVMNARVAAGTFGAVTTVLEK